MTPRSQIADYSLIGDCETAALVDRNGSIDWLCWPRFDSDACFAALLGDETNGAWRISPQSEFKSHRRYLPGTLILETVFETDEGSVALIDFMPPRSDASHIVRIVEGRRGKVALNMAMTLRFGYGLTVPWVTRMEDGALRAIAGPSMTILRTPVPTRGEHMNTVAEFEVSEGERASFVLSHRASHLPLPEPLDPAEAEAATEAFWSERLAKTCQTTGGLVAAPTTSLPEQFGGQRNWDYRFCWIRDSTLTLLAMMNSGYYEEASAWLAWVQRAVAGDPADMQIMYGIGGERRLTEWTADWLPGHERSTPVRVGNAAHEQFQLDVYGELMDTFHQARIGGLHPPA
jgi:GH15 family glucan-1,4-alpha-glucosidase